MTPTTLGLFSLLLLCFAPPPFLSYARKNLVEINTLISFKLNLHDPFKSIDGWDQTTPSAPCDWHGITCTGENNHVTQLHLTGLQLSGPLSQDFPGLAYLEKLILNSNFFNGTIPPSLSRCKRLKHLVLQNNFFSGHLNDVPLERLPNLTVLHLANNNLSGALSPLLFELPNIEIINLRGNSISGQIPTNLSSLSRLEVLDLGWNNLSGGIPKGISECLSLTSLSLVGNFLSGRIPDLLRTRNIESLDLSANNLSGEIPANFARLSLLKYLNMSRNNLEGQIPVPLGSRFNDSSIFSGNSGLCGKPLEVKCGDAGATWGDQRNTSEQNQLGRRKTEVIVGVSSACFLALCFYFCVSGFLRSRNRLKKGASLGGNGEPELVMFNIKNITLDNTTEATRRFNEENVLMRTSYAIVFKASYSDGMVLSIYSLLDESVDEEAFRKEAECLGKLKHRNLAVLRGYCAGPPGLRLLVYDYMPNGNLDTLIQEASHQDDPVLNWPMCRLIALGIAEGLAFLHSSDIIHGNVKPQSVLFDADFEVHLSDFGLDGLVSSSSNSPSAGTVGYVSPENGLTGKVTKESDVYSYGIVLLELLTRKRSSMFSQGDDDIVKWVKEQLQRGEITELAGPGLVAEFSSEVEFLLGVKLGLLCTATDPLDRPTMSDVVSMLERCRASPNVPCQLSSSARLSDSSSSSESFWVISTSRGTSMTRVP